MIEESSDWSEIIDLNILTLSKEGLINQEMKNCSSYCCQLRYQNLQKEYLLTLEPSIVIKNCLPVSVHYQVFEGPNTKNLKRVMEGKANKQ